MKKLYLTKPNLVVMKTNPTKRNSGLLPLGFVISLSITLLSFEYISADVKHAVPFTGKHSAAEIEMVQEVEVIKPKLTTPSQPQQPSTPSVPVIAPPVVVGVVVPVVGPVDPNPPVIIEPGGGGGIPIIDPEEPISDEPFVIVEDMPTFEKFLTIKDKQERELATQKEILNIVMGSVGYPEMARQMGVEGKVYVDFVVATDGTIKDIKIARGVQADLDKEALKGVKNIPVMVPGKQRGKKVNVKYTIPIVFKLDK